MFSKYCCIYFFQLHHSADCCPQSYFVPFPCFSGWNPIGCFPGPCVSGLLVQCGPWEALQAWRVREMKMPGYFSLFIPFLWVSLAGIYIFHGTSSCLTGLPGNQLPLSDPGTWALVTSPFIFLAWGQQWFPEIDNFWVSSHHCIWFLSSFIACVTNFPYYVSSIVNILSQLCCFGCTLTKAGTDNHFKISEISSFVKL